MCLIEIEGILKPTIACATFLSMDFISIKTNSFLILQARENIIEFLLLNHPLDCPICDQGGECDLQDQSIIFGKDLARYSEKKRVVTEKTFNFFIKTVMTRCIHCTKCIRYFNEIIGTNTIGLLGRGSLSEIGSYVQLYLSTEIIGNVIDLCPVGALTSKPSSFLLRSWELTSFESIDLLDSFCSAILIEVRNTNILRVLPKKFNKRNSFFITDKARFSYDAFKTQRLLAPSIRLFSTYSLFQHTFINSSWEHSFNYISINLASCIEKYTKKAVFFLSGSFLAIDTLLLFKAVCLFFCIPNINENYYNEVDVRASFLINRNLYLPTFIDVCIFYNIDTKIENAILHLKLKKIINIDKISTTFFYIGSYIETTIPLIHVGIDLHSILDIFYGKHFACYAISATYICNFITTTNAYTDEVPITYLMEVLIKHISVMFCHNKNNLYTGDTTIQEYNIRSIAASNITDLPFYTPRFIYLLGVDSLHMHNYRRLASFIVYQGIHADIGSFNANVLLPSITHFEYMNAYLDSTAHVQYAFPVTNALLISTKSQPLTELCVLNCLVYYLDSYIKATYYKTSSYVYTINNIYSNSLLTLYYYTTTIFIKEESLFLKCLYTTNFWLFLNMLSIEDIQFIIEQRNFFTMDTYCRNSLHIQRHASSLLTFS